MRLLGCLSRPISPELSCSRFADPSRCLCLSLMLSHCLCNLLTSVPSSSSLRLLWFDPLPLAGQLHARMSRPSINAHMSRTEGQNTNVNGNRAANANMYNPEGQCWSVNGRPPKPECQTQQVKVGKAGVSWPKGQGRNVKAEMSGPACQDQYVKGGVPSQWSLALSL